MACIAGRAVTGRQMDTQTMAATLKAHVHRHMHVSRKKRLNQPRSNSLGRQNGFIILIY